MSLLKKRLLASGAIGLACVKNSALAAVPVPPAVETSKTLVALSAIEIALCSSIAVIYFGEKIKEKDGVITLMKECGIAVATGSGLAVAATKVGQAAVNEILNFIPVVGWGLKGGIAFTLTGGVGIAFLAVCDEKYRKEYLVQY